MLESLLFSIVPIITMIIGIYIGYKLRGDGGKDILPNPKSPARIIKEHKDKIQAEQEFEDTKKWIEEINNYSGEFKK